VTSLALSVHAVGAASTLEISQFLLRTVSRTCYYLVSVSRYPHRSIEKHHIHSIAVTAVPTATWVSERVENAQRICKLAEDCYSNGTVSRIFP